MTPKYHLRAMPNGVAVICIKRLATPNNSGLVKVPEVVAWFFGEDAREDAERSRKIKREGL
jgi:hypothetical protein